MRNRELGLRGIRTVHVARGRGGIGWLEPHYKVEIVRRCAGIKSGVGECKPGMVGLVVTSVMKAEKAASIQLSIPSIPIS